MNNGITINEGELLQFLQDLIRIESINPTLVKGGSGEARIAAFIGAFLQKMGLEVEYQELGEKRTNVIGILRGSGKGRAIMLNGHTDTVSAQGMEIEPFNPLYKDGRVYGRGSIDMKGGLAAMVLAVKTIIDQGVKLAGDVILAFVADEEYASIGTEKVVEEYKADGAIVCEPTNLQIVIAHKGFAWSRVEVLGRAAHGSMPDKGIDAIVKTGKVLVELDNLGQRLTARKVHPLLGSPSVHASLIQGGTELSTYPDYCRLEIERRTLPGENKEQVIMELDELMERIRNSDSQFQAKWEVFFYRPALEVCKNEPIVHSLEKSYKEVLKQNPVYGGMSGWLDSAILTEAGTPTVIFGPAGDGLHGAVEFVEFNSVLQSCGVLIETIINFCGLQPPDSR